MGFREERKNLSSKGFSLFPTLKYFQHYSSDDGIGLDLTVVLRKIFIIGGVGFQIAVEVPVQHFSATLSTNATLESS